MELGIAPSTFDQSNRLYAVSSYVIWRSRDAATIDGGEFYAQLKAPSRVRDPASGELKYRWTETGALDHYRYAHAYDHLFGAYRRRVGCLVLLR